MACLTTTIFYLNYALSQVGEEREEKKIQRCLFGLLTMVQQIHQLYNEIVQMNS